MSPTASSVLRPSGRQQRLWNEADATFPAETDLVVAALALGAGTTLYIGNPPYVRHHQIEGKWKEWLSDQASRLGLKASQRAGLHVHFFLATARNARPGDFGAFITAAEWLDVNYGSLVRSLVVDRLGGRSVTVIEPTAQPFPDAASTAAITTFESDRSRFPSISGGSTVSAIWMASNRDARWLAGV